MEPKGDCIIMIIVRKIAEDLRKRESRYMTAKGSHMRMETVSAVENGRGSARSIMDYIQYYCDKYPGAAYRLFYNAAIKIAQQQTF